MAGDRLQAADDLPGGDQIAGLPGWLSGAAGVIQRKLANEGRYVSDQVSRGRVPYQATLETMVPGGIGVATGLAQRALVQKGIEMERAPSNKVVGDQLIREFKKQMPAHRQAVVNPMERGSKIPLGAFSPLEFYANQLSDNNLRVSFGMKPQDSALGELLSPGNTATARYHWPEKGLGAEVHAPPVDITSDGKRWMYPGTAMAHEMGHALDDNTPRGRLLMSRMRRGQRSNPAEIVGAVGVGASREDRGIFGAAAEGALSSLAQPINRTILEAEARADKAGRALARSAGTPWSVPAQLVLRSTYPMGMMGAGAAQGAGGEILNRVAQQGVDWTVDRIEEMVRPAEHSKMEQGLEQYGYDRNKFKFRQVNPDGSVRMVPR